MPPASKTSADPARIMSDANMTVWSPDPHTVLVGRRGRPASCERPIERSIQENRIFEEIGHLVCGAGHRVEEPDQAVHPAPEDPNGGLARPGGPVDESNEVP